MRFRRISGILTLCWLVNIKYDVFAYDLDNCPSSSQWKLRAKAMCNASPENYSCLYDLIQNKYKESCSGKPDYVKPGKRYVIRGERDNDNCNDSRYQPVKLWSNRSSKCEILKYDCNEMGQVIASNGSTTEDRTCRCNYNKGFDFVIKPINVCYCIPSEEDCSCYRKSCSSDEKLTKDYECASKLRLDLQYGRCFVIVETQTASFDTSSTSQQRPASTIFPVYERDKNMEYHNVQFVTVMLVSITFLSIWTIIFMIFIMRIHQPFNVITANRKDLIEEMDVALMKEELCLKGFDINIPATVRSRREKAHIICDFLEKQPTEFMVIVYEILEKHNLDLILETLKASEGKNRFTHFTQFC
ncbi:uncharacterized protein LOC127707341 [Mytilus californianus]|uniref:uncharacterized protein LOC127707341 n=1 Tax=Mytilus californianus TaxID=6549 RepID=UPI002246FD5B|nr:uncharacterized protein LOC127707341 [Mytilus californianus]